MTPAGGGRVLVAGIGNIFLGDDGFGVEVVRRVADAELPARVDVVDYGIRGVHLAYDLLDSRYDALVLVDALSLGEAAGTLGLIEVDLDDPGWRLAPADVLDTPAGNAHVMDPESVLRLLRSLGGMVHRVLVVGCQPADLTEGMELSEPVRAALSDAVRMVTAAARDEAARLDPQDAHRGTESPRATRTVRLGADGVTTDA
jgi:hydrogenase maturation protease